MGRIRTSEIGRHAGEHVRVEGWLRTIRSMGGLTFAVLRDGWGEVQAVWELERDPLAGLGAESVVGLQGVAVASAQAPGGFEVREPTVTTISAVTETLPLPLGRRSLKANLPVLLDSAIVSNRHPSRRAMFALSSEAMAAFRAELDRQGFTEIATPKILGTSTEGGSNVFAVDYFGRPAFLAQSPQFYKQAMVGVFERVYEVGPVFRAEPHDTPRHVNEYVSLDAELGFIADHHDVMVVLRDVIAAMVARLVERRAADLATLGAVVPPVPAVIPELDFGEAKEWLATQLSAEVLGEPDLSPTEERLLGSLARERWASEFLFVTGYPLAKRPFYTHGDSTRPGRSNGFDLLFRGMEVVTGGQRLHRYSDYRAALDARGLDPEPFAWYLDAFRFGMPPHGGFAIGLERFLMQLTGVPNVRLATLFPRDLQRLVP